MRVPERFKGTVCKTVKPSVRIRSLIPNSYLIMNSVKRLINNLYVATGFTVIELFAMVGLMAYIAYVIYEFLIVFRSIHG
jgi:hypothetical protein